MEDIFSSEDITKKILSEFKPILIIYFPFYYTTGSRFSRIEALKNKLGEAFKDKYVLLTIPYQGDDFKLDLLSVIKSQFIRDSDLEKYIKILQDKINKDEELSVTKSKDLNDALEGINKFFK